VIVAEPADTPVITPVPLTVAIASSLLVQLPPAVALANIVVEPSHTAVPPVMFAGSAFTITVAVDIQPVPIAYVISVAPALTPLTSPVVLLTVATDVLLLSHTPPTVALLSVVV
jgi:hypothetical protein